MDEALRSPVRIPLRCIALAATLALAAGATARQQCHLPLAARIGGADRAVAMLDGHLVSGDGSTVIISSITVGGVTEVSRVELTGLVTDVQLRGTIAFVTTLGGTALHSVDLSNPASPIILDSLSVPIADYAAQSMVVDGSTIYALSSGLTQALVVINADNPADLSTTRFGFPFASPSSRLTQCGSRLFFNEQPTSRRIQVINISTLGLAASFQATSNITTTRGSACRLFAFQPPLRVEIFDTSVPTPALLGSINGDFRNGWIEGTTAYLFGVDAQGSILSIFDVTNPAAPVHRSTIPVPGTPFADAALSGSTLIATDEARGQVILDVADAAHPIVRHTTRNLGVVQELALLPGSLTLLREAAGLAVVDRSGPLEVISLLDLGTETFGFSVDGTMAYVAAGFRGVVAVDISDPTAPVVTGEIDTPGVVRSVTARDGLVGFIDTVEGLRIAQAGAGGTLTAIAEAGPIEPSTNPHRMVLSGGFIHILRPMPPQFGLVQPVDVRNPAAPIVRPSYLPFNITDTLDFEPIGDRLAAVGRMTATVFDNFGGMLYTNSFYNIFVPFCSIQNQWRAGASDSRVWRFGGSCGFQGLDFGVDLASSPFLDAFEQRGLVVNATTDVPALEGTGDGRVVHIAGGEGGYGLLDLDASLMRVTDQPESLELHVGDTAAFTAAAEAIPGQTMLYSWRRNNFGLQDGVLPSGAIVSGATTPRLTITGVTHREIGEYVLRVAVSCGTVSTADAIRLDLCVADWDGDRVIDSGDFYGFIEDFFASDADTDGGGRTTSSDFFAFLEQFFEGCD